MQGEKWSPLVLVSTSKFIHQKLGAAEKQMANNRGQRFERETIEANDIKSNSKMGSQWFEHFAPLGSLKYSSDLQPLSYGDSSFISFLSIILTLT